MEHLSTVELVACGNNEFRNERYAQALVFYKAASMKKDFDTVDFAHLARTYAKLELFDQAKEAFELFLAKYPDAYIERFQLGLVLRDLNNADNAIEIFDQVLAQEPTFAPALYYKSLVCIEKDDLESAKFLLSELLRNTEDDNLYVKLTNELIESLNLEINVEASPSEQ
ncbi:tetratricopeptide repeat protein [Pleionea sediminis]|uniref:tetratricopeptide repeat protein n=1 Tax=Pleionea sediminis TaxID=2569479 RepID=UPI0011869714|nr:tetratricopeptide repeat protein [Pleionea sediminis]